MDREPVLSSKHYLRSQAACFQDQNGKCQDRRRIERAWLFWAKGFFLSSAQKYLELISPGLPPCLPDLHCCLCLYLNFTAPLSPPHSSTSVWQWPSSPSYRHSSCLGLLSMVTVLVTIPSFATSGHLIGVTLHIGSTNPAHITANGSFRSSLRSPHWLCHVFPARTD